jgi:hypothetical protein
MSACADCIKGSLDEGTPKGEDNTIAGVPCYITKPAAAAANGCAVILATDIFGYRLINARLIADVYADAGYICVVPDYFEGEPMNMQLLEAFEALPTQNFFGKIASGLQLALQIVNLVSTAAPPLLCAIVSIKSACATLLRWCNLPWPQPWLHPLLPSCGLQHATAARYIFQILITFNSYEHNAAAEPPPPAVAAAAVAIVRAAGSGSTPSVMLLVL